MKAIIDGTKIVLHNDKFQAGFSPGFETLVRNVKITYDKNVLVLRGDEILFDFLIYSEWSELSKYSKSAITKARPYFIFPKQDHVKSGWVELRETKKIEMRFSYYTVTDNTIEQVTKK